MGDTNLYGLISQGPEISCRREGGSRFTARPAHLVVGGWWWGGSNAELQQAAGFPDKKGAKLKPTGLKEL